MKHGPQLGSVTSLVLSAACWGLGTVMTKHALDGVPPFTLTVVQLAASAIFLWALVAVQRLRLPPRREMIRPAMTGLLEPGLTITFAVLGLKLTTASMTTLIFASQPILIILLAWLVLRERLTRPLIALSALAVIGVVLVAGVNPGDGNSGTLTGNALIVASLFACSLYLVLARRMVMNLDPLLLVALQQIVGLAWVLLVWPIELTQIGLAGLKVIPPGAWLWAAASGIVYYALGFWFYVIGLKGTPASLAALFLSLTSIFGVGGAYVFLGERLFPIQWIGAVLILLAVLGVSRPQPAEVDAAHRQSPISNL